jgi:hypothetical protein
LDRRYEVTDLRKLRNEELHNLYCALSLITVTWAGHVAGMRRVVLYIGYGWTDIYTRSDAV